VGDKSVNWYSAKVKGYTYVHLGGETFLAIADHGVGGEGNDRRRRNTILVLPLSDLSCSFETSHDRHLHVHEHAVEALLLNVLNGFKTVVRHCDPVVIFLQNPDSKLLVHSVVFRQQDVERFRVI
jgi:hypothetical protein